MNIIDNLNKRLTIDDGEVCYGGEEDILKVIEQCPIALPDDYIGFLRSISGSEDLGISFSVDESDDLIGIWSAKMALMKYSEFNDFNSIAVKNFLGQVWLIGDDLGDLVYFYGNGREGNGLYRTGAGDLGFERAEKIADTITEFLVDGVGIDAAITL